MLGGELVGPGDTRISKFDKIEEAGAESLSFIANPKYEGFAMTTMAAVLLVGRKFSAPYREGLSLIKLDDPYTGLAILLDKVQRMGRKEKNGIHAKSDIAEGSTYGENLYLGAFASVGEEVKIGKNVKIYPGAIIGDRCVLGDDCTLYAGVKIYHDCVIGNRCILHAGVVIGSDGFGFAPQKDGSFFKVPQTGNVILGDDVEIGANTVVDRGTLGSTMIHKGVKLDNLVQIAHNVEIGQNTVIAAQAGVSGSTKLGKNVMVGGQAGFVGHIKIADGTKINAQSGVSKSVEAANQSLTGAPAMDFREAYKMLAWMKRIPEIAERLSALEKNTNK